MKTSFEVSVSLERKESLMWRKQPVYANPPQLILLRPHLKPDIMFTQVSTWRAETAHNSHPSPDKAYLSLHKLVPVVMRKRSENEDEKDRLLIINFRANPSRNLPVWMSGCVISWFLSCSLKKSSCDWCSESSQGSCLTGLVLCTNSEALGKPSWSFFLKITVKNHDDTLARNVCFWFLFWKPLLPCTLPSPLPWCHVPGQVSLLQAQWASCITFCCSFRGTNPAVSWPIYLDPSIH